MSESVPTTLVAPDGRRFDVPATGVAQLKEKGFRDLTDSERKDAELQAKYGTGIVPAVGAAASGAASAATFGLSDVALAHTPLAEANREVSERHPTAHAVGAGAALALPIVGELAGASLAGKAAGAAGAGITGITKASTALGEVAGAVAPKAIAPIAKAVTQAGAEGAAFQIGANLGDAARRDAALDAETLLAHTGEAAILGGGISAAIPVAGKVARWSAEKALGGLETGVQALRAAGFKGADLALTAADAGAGAVARNADAIGAGVASTARGAASVLDKGAAAIVGQADNIGAAAEGAAGKIAGAVDEHLLPKIRQGLSEQTGRPDVINDVFASGAEGQALRSKLGSETITGTRAVHSEELGKALNQVWDASLSNKPMFDDLALGVKRDLQHAELAASPLTKEAQRAVIDDIAREAKQTLGTLEKYNGTAKTFFADALDDFAKATKNPTSESLYAGLDGLKVATDKIAKFAKGAELGDSGAAFAAEEARRFRTFAKNKLEDASTWGEAGALQHEVNAAYTTYRRAFDQFEKQFAASKAKGQVARVLDGQKIQKWSRDITGQAGEVRNAVVDDLVSAQADLINLTDRLAKRAQQQARATLGSSTAAETARAAATPEATSDILSKSLGQAHGVATAKATATKEIDRAEVLQQTQSAILSRQGAGVNPLPVQLAQQIGGGALVGGAIGGIPGAIIGGGITSALQKYGAITSNPKSAIEFLNKVDSLRRIDKERVSSWIKATLGETESAGARGALKEAAERVDGKRVGDAVRRGAESVQGAIPGAREALGIANKAAARKILEAGDAGRRGLESLASHADSASNGLMERLLPAVSYADVTNARPEEWWKRTQKTLVDAQANPQKLLDKVHSDLEGISEDLPDTADAIAQQQLRVLGYLADKMPRNPRPYMLGDPSWTPDPTAMKAYRDLVLVATKPDTLLPLITVGTATRAQVDAVKSLWPKTFAEQRHQVIDAVMGAASEGHPVPYQARLRLGQLLQVPLDASQEPGFAAWLQTPAQPAQQNQSNTMASAQTVRGNFNLHSDGLLPASARAAERK